MPEPSDKLSAQRDLALLKVLRPTDDPSTGLSMRQATPQAERYRTVLASILKKYGSLAEFQTALGTLPEKPGQLTLADLALTPTTTDVAAAASPRQETSELLSKLPAERGFGELRAAPGFLQRKREAAARVVKSFSTGFAREFGEAPISTPRALGSESLGLPPGVAGVEPVQRVLSRAGGEMKRGGEVALRGIAGVFGGTFEADIQLLKEFGFDETEANKIARDIFAFGDVLATVTVTAPPGAVRGAARKLAGTEKVVRLRKGLREEREAILAARKINLARRRMREEAKRLGLPPEEMERRLAVATQTIRSELNAKAEALGAPFLRAPEEILDNVPVLTQEALTPEVQKQAVAIAKRVLGERGIDPTALAFPRVQDTVVSLLKSDDNFSIRLFTEINAAGMSKDTFLDAFLLTGSEAGRALQIRSRFYDRLRRAALKEDKLAVEVLAGFKETEAAARLGVTAMEQLEPLWRRSGRLFRKLVITLPTTAIRNFLDASLGRVNIGAMNRVFDESLRRVFPAGQDIAGPLDPFGELGRIFAPTIARVEELALPGRFRERIVSKVGKRRVIAPKALTSKRKVDIILDAFPEYKSSLRRAVEVDILRTRIRTGNAGALDHFEAFVDKVGLFMNRAQEFIVRYQVFGAKLDQELRRVGSSLDEVIEFGDIPVGMDRALRLATEQALDITFALNPASRKGPLAKVFRSYVGLIDAVPGAPIFVETFPGFLFNLTKFIAEQTPSAGLRLIRPINRARIAEGDMSVVAREVTGTVILAAAISIRQGDFPGITPGARFDEILNDKGERISFLPFASIAPFLFIADLLIRIDEGRILASSDDLRELRRGLTASSPEIGRLTSVGEDFIEALFDIDTTQDLENLTGLLGEKATGFLRPLQLLRDFREEYNEAVRVQRERRGHGFMGPITDLIAPETLPERESPTRGEPLVAPRVDLPFGLGSVSGGLFSQVSGVRLRDPRTPIEREFVRLGFGAKDLSPKTGSPRLNALVLRFQGEFVGTIGNQLVKMDQYKALGVKEQQEELRVLLSGGKSIFSAKKVIGTRERALKLARLVAPFAFLRRRFKSMPGTQKEAFIQRYNRLMEGTGIGLPAEEFIQYLERMARRDLERQGL